MITLEIMTKDRITEEYINWLNDPEFNKYLSCKVHQTRATVEKYIDSYTYHPAKRIFCILNDGEHIGNITTQFTNEGLYVGISIKSSVQRKGYALKALQELEKFYPNKDMVAGIDQDNTASLALFKKAGYFVEKVVMRKIRDTSNFYQRPL